MSLTTSTFSRSMEILAPAKINLMLAVTGQRPDGYHDLVSVAAPLAFGDKLYLEWMKGSAEEDTLTISGSELAVTPDNLVFKALRAFREKVPLPKGSFSVKLEKQIPVGAGLGGGSSDATATLRALNVWAESPLSESEMLALAGSIGSDCPLFLENGPVLMEGRGEKITALGENVTAFLKKRKVLVFKPPFGIDTAWAYGQFRKNPQYYYSSEDAACLLMSWKKKGADKPFVCCNNFESVAFRKYPLLGVCIKRLKEEGLTACLSGSGSACFCLLDGKYDEKRIVSMLKDLVGDSIFITTTSFLHGAGQIN